VLSNFGRLRELVIAGQPVGSKLASERVRGPAPLDPAGSIIVVVATDAPLSSRQLGRVLRRVQNGIARTGSTTASGSGEVVLGFSTAARIPHFPQDTAQSILTLREDGPLFDLLFAAVTEATEEAVVNSLLNGVTVEGRDGARRVAFPVERLAEFFECADGRP
jgi:D-aminopeptidase